MSNNTISGNKIHHYAKHLYDVAGIYTLSAQPGSVISNNVVDSIYKAPYPHDPVHWFYLYTDEGSSYFTVKNNWTPEEKYLQNANGPGNVWHNNGPMVADSIKSAAGLPKEYRYLLKDKSTHVAGQAVNSLVVDKPVVLELIFKNKRPSDRASLEKICAENNIPSDAIYQWENHLLIFAGLKDPEALRKQLLSAFKNAEVKSYNKPFYEFNRQKNCRLEPAKEWDHVILSANLVNDEKMQKEYLDYHATQFEKWPELSQGFCNADFQRLLIFKNGRQLVLIISIPKGKNLDELNPRTTLNNPRVDEWNAMMKKYQEGIEGTKPGEVWVFFNK